MLVPLPCLKVSRSVSRPSPGGVISLFFSPLSLSHRVGVHCLYSQVAAEILDTAHHIHLPIYVEASSLYVFRLKYY